MAEDELRGSHSLRKEATPLHHRHNAVINLTQPPTDTLPHRRFNSPGVAVPGSFQV